MKQRIITTLLVFFLFMFSGCYRYIYWAESVVDQADPIETCCAKVQPYFRSARVYDQFTTIGLFDALWLDDVVIDAYACAHAAKYGYTRQQYYDFLNSQCDELSSYISFYVLAVVPGSIGTVGILLTDANPLWVMQLRVGNNYFKPAKIKIVELDHEYRYFFGKRLTVFKKQYIVQFNAYDEYEIPLITSATPDVELIFRAVGHQTSMTWCITDIQRDTMYPPLRDDIMAYDIKINI